MPKIVAIDVKLDEIKQRGVAYYRTPKELKEFLQLVEKKEKIIGFIWDSDDPNNFGVVLGEE